MKKSAILWMTRTAVLIALLVVFQWGLGSLSGNNQLVVGPAVNLVLIVAATISGLYSGMAVAVVSPFLAYVLGIGPNFLVLVPFIAFGNLTLVLVWYFIAKNASATVDGYIRLAAALVAGAVAKFAVMYLTIVKLAIPVFLTNLKPPAIETMSYSLGILQLYTAAIGGALALIVVPILRKAVKADK